MPNPTCPNKQTQVSIFGGTRISGPSGPFEILAPTGAGSLCSPLCSQQWGDKRTHEQGWQKDTRTGGTNGHTNRGTKDTRTGGTNGHTNRGDEWTHKHNFAHTHTHTVQLFIVDNCKNSTPRTQCRTQFRTQCGMQCRTQCRTQFPTQCLINLSLHVGWYVARQSSVPACYY